MDTFFTMVSQKQIQSDANTWQNFESPTTFQEDISELEVLPNGVIHLHSQILDELDSKT